MPAKRKHEPRHTGCTLRTPPVPLGCGVATSVGKTGRCVLCSSPLKQHCRPCLKFVCTFGAREATLGLDARWQPAALSLWCAHAALSLSPSALLSPFAVSLHPLFPCNAGYAAPDLEARISKGEKLYVHCWGGRGRAGTVGACLLASMYK